MTDPFPPFFDDPPPDPPHPLASRTCGCPTCTTWRAWVARNLDRLKEKR